MQDMQSFPTLLSTVQPEELARKVAGSGKPILTLDSPANANLLEFGACAVGGDGRTDLPT